MQGPNWKFPSHIYTNASDTTLGAVLDQKEDKHYHAIYYIIKHLKGAELKYTMIEKEFLSIIHAINKFKHYIIGHPVFVHTYHSSI